MKKSLFLVSFMLSSLAMAADLSSPAFFNFSGDCLPDENPSSITLTESNVTVTVATSYSGGLSSGQTSYTLTEDNITSLNTNVRLTSENGFSNENSQTYISSGSITKGSNLTITLSGLNSGSIYNVSFVSGLTFEGQGAWTIVSTTNDYDSCSMNLGSQCQPVYALGVYNVVGITADHSGCITFNITNPDGKHTTVINSMAVALQSVPEPATASLSLLALGTLALRRHRQ